MKLKDRQTDRQAGRLVDKTYIQTEEKTDCIQTGRQIDRQIDRQTLTIATKRGEDRQGETNTFNEHIFVAHLVLSQRNKVPM